VRRRNSTFLSELGPGGLSSLALAFAAGLAGLGLPVAARLRRVLAATAGDPLAPADVVLVLGRELASDRPTPAFAARLDHAHELVAAGWAGRVLVAGGLTGVATRSEAAAGREHLLARGVAAEAVWTEERSRHTLENLFNARERLRHEGLARVLLVSDPLHLARAATMARGLGLDVGCSPAVASPPRRGSLGWWRRAAHEAFLLHWYHVGLAYSRAVGLRAALARVT
jgi:uncharacterized SAM-binding protein YcdF (DUF218 family)